MIDRQPTVTPSSFQPKRWEELSREQRKSHYWAAIPDDTDSILDGWDYEIVYVYFDGRWSVYRPGSQRREPLTAFRFLFSINLPDIDPGKP